MDCYIFLIQYSPVAVLSEKPTLLGSLIVLQSGWDNECDTDDHPHLSYRALLFKLAKFEAMNPRTEEDLSVVTTTIVFIYLSPDPKLDAKWKRSTRVKASQCPITHVITDMCRQFGDRP